MSDKPKPPASGFPMEIPEELRAVYSNVARISHTPFDFTLDFSQALPGKPKAEILSRVIMSPVGAKLFMRALADNIARYEANFGEITLPRGDSSLANDLFKRTPPPNSHSSDSTPDSPTPEA